MSSGLENYSISRPGSGSVWLFPWAILLQDIGCEINNEKGSKKCAALIDINNVIRCCELFLEIYGPV
jgi:hypothetical protein